MRSVCIVILQREAIVDLDVCIVILQREAIVDLDVCIVILQKEATVVGIDVCDLNDRFKTVKQLAR